MNTTTGRATEPRITSLRISRQKPRVIFFILVLLAALPAADATYMIGKAKLAQILIARAWQSETKPAVPWPWADTYPVARIVGPSIDLEAWVLAGASGHALSFGPGLADGSVAIGQPGVVMIAGHRDTDFKPLKQLIIDDNIFLEDRSKSLFTYRVSDISIADARYDSIAASTTQSTLVLVTCYPFDAVTAGGPLRYVIQAKLVSESVVARQSG